MHNRLDHVAVKRGPERLGDVNKRVAHGEVGAAAGVASHEACQDGTLNWT